MMTEEFLNYLQLERNRSLQTVQSYAEDLQAFEAYFQKLEGELSWESVDSDIIRNWMESMMDKGNSTASINRRLSALRSLYRFALSRGFVSSDPSRMIKGPKKRKSLPQFLKENEMDRLLDSDEWGNSFFDVRARAIMLMFYETGIRLAELVNLDEGSIDFELCEIKVLGKRNKHRIVPFGKELCNALYIYNKVKVANVPRVSNALFVDRKGDRVKRECVRRIVKRYLSRFCTLKKLSPHVLRHTFATVMLNNDAGLEDVKQLLGHESLSTTEIYTHTTFEQLKKTYVTAHPRA